MSQRPSASRPASRSPPDGQKITLPPVQLRDDPGQGGSQAERQLEYEGGGYQQPQQLQTSPQPARTSLTGTPSNDDWRSLGPSRDLGVHSMLNPTEPEDTGSSSSRVSGSNTESPVSAAFKPASHFGTSPSMTASHTLSGQQMIGTPPTAEGYGPSFPRTRRILTPKSPRAVSLARGAPSGTIDAQRSPFLHTTGTRLYRAEPGPSLASDIPPMPTPPGQPPQQYGLPPPASTPSAERRMSSMQALAQTPLSQSVSPSISAASQNTSSQTSPPYYVFQKGGGAPPSQPGTGTSFIPGGSFGASMQQQGGGVQFQAPPAVPEGPYSAPSSTTSSKQTSADPIQVLTISTSQGLYHVPVDVHQASRLADEKRARNAGASARFRQRRKEKEKEASTNIEKLQHQTRELERKVAEVQQERDFYRAERDRFRDIVFRIPSMRDLAMQAPPSPQSGRQSSFQGPMSQVTGPPPAIGFQAGETGSERATRRRRTEEFTSSTYSHPSRSILPPVQPSSYPSGLGQAQQNLPPLRIDNTSAAQTTTPTITPNITPSTTGPPPPYDTYARGSYGGRGWTS